jgi:hypothetical protein
MMRHLWLVLLLCPWVANAQLPLREDTASQVITIGPFVDETDGNTEETELTIVNTDVRISKNGAAAVSKNSGGCAHNEDGMYSCTLDATDTNTVGRITLWVHVAGALLVKQAFSVLEESVYDAVFAADAVAPPSAAQVATAVGNIIVEPNGSITLKCATAIDLADAAGTWTKVGNVVTFRDPSGTSNRIVGTATTDARGNVTLSCP